MAIRAERRGDRAAATAARRCALVVLRRVLEEGAYADIAFRTEADRFELEGRDRAFAMRLAYGAIQRKSTLDYLTERLTERPVERIDAPLVQALRLGLYQLVFLDGVPEHAAVSESVELAKKSSRGGHALVNATLRRATREARALVDALPERTPEEAALRHSHPRWIAEHWWEMLGPEEAVALMTQDNEPAESAVRANTLKTDAGELAAMLARDGVVTHTDPLVPEALVLERPYDVHGSPLFEEGLLMPQSRASMLVAHVVDPRPGDQVLDLCAAPGAKTTHLAALMNDEGRVVAVDVDSRRLEAVAANCARLGARCIETLEADAAADAFEPGFDRVLVDPPCSDLGTLQARPDARWRKLPDRLEELRALQRRILDSAAAAVKSGGRLVYSTCTISAQENERQIEGFLARRPGFQPLDLSTVYPDLFAEHARRFLQTLPHRHGTDGFFVAALERKA